MGLVDDWVYAKTTPDQLLSISQEGLVPNTYGKSIVDENEYPVSLAEYKLLLREKIATAESVFGNESDDSEFEKKIAETISKLPKQDLIPKTIVYDRKPYVSYAEVLLRFPKHLTETNSYTTNTISPLFLQIWDRDHWREINP